MKTPQVVLLKTGEVAGATYTQVSTVSRFSSRQVHHKLPRAASDGFSQDRGSQKMCTSRFARYVSTFLGYPP